MTNKTKKRMPPTENWKKKAKKKRGSYQKILPIIDGEYIQFFYDGTTVCMMEMMILTDDAPSMC